MNPLTIAWDLFSGLSWTALALIVLMFWIAYKQGWPKVLAIGNAIGAWWNKTTRALQSDVSTLKADVALIKEKVGIVTPAPAPAAPAAPAAPKAAS